MGRVKKLKKDTKTMIKIDSMENADIDALCSFRAIRNKAVVPESLFSSENNEDNKVEKKKVDLFLVVAVIMCIVVCAIALIILL